MERNIKRKSFSTSCALRLLWQKTEIFPHRLAGNAYSRETRIVKGFCFIFIFYVLIAITQPCQDIIAFADRCNGAGERTHIEKQTDKTPSSDLCSPFCVCSCCSISVVQQPTSLMAVSTSIVDDPSSKLSDYKTPSTSSFPNSIWQPPKV